MAYWGEALTYTHPVWVEQDLPAARAVLAKLGPTPEARAAKAPTQREKDYLHAVEILYGQGDKVSRDIAYSDAMGRMRQKYPDDLEAASLYAVALLGTCQHERNTAVYMKAAAVAEEVFAKNPQHPGAIHYLIHAYDDPVHAPLGLRPARVYADVAGAASHAQHMPSHIFFALGMWDDAISANIRSVAVADERIKRKGLGVSERNYHSIQWLTYAYLQEGRDADAHAVIADVERTGGTRGLSVMKAYYALETGKQDESLMASNAPMVSMAVTALNAYGLVGARNGKIEETRRAFEKIQARLNAPAHAAAEGGHADANHAPGMADPSANKTAEIMLQQLQAELWIADGKRAQALELLRKTAAEEDAVTFEFGPPVPVKPAHELYADELLAAGRAKEAVVEYQHALARAPRRAQALRGLAKAAAAAGETDVSRNTRDDLKSFWHGAEN
jgi:tetratricopeptide (TPR) repeat protein